MQPDTSDIEVSAVMPCLNEERTLQTCIRKAQDAIRRLGVRGEVIVVDIGSTDRSVEIAQALGARVIHQAMRGYGAALAAGIEAAAGRFVVMADADDSYDWLSLGDYVRALDGGLDVVIGNRFRGGIGPGAMPPLHRYLGNPVLSWLARRVHGIPIGDFHCGMRGLRREVWNRMELRTPGMEFATEFIVLAGQLGLRMGEIPTTLVKDGRDRPPHLRSFRDGWRHLRFILGYGPNYLYLAPAMPLLLVGLLLVAGLAAGPRQVGGLYFGTHFLALGGMLLLLGWNILHLGLMAKLIVLRSRSRLSAWARTGFSLERGLLVGGALFLAGLLVDLRLLWRWLAYPGIDMSASIHPAFVATLAIVLGVNMMFSSFLMWLLLIEQGPGVVQASATATREHPGSPAGPRESGWT